MTNGDPTGNRLTIPQALRLAISHHRGGRLGEAERIYRNILKVEPANVDCTHLLGVIAYQSGRYEPAINLISKAIGLRPSSPDFHNNLGEVYRALDRLEEAKSCYEKALKLKQDYPEAHNNLGLIFYQQGHMEEARQQFERALALNPKAHEAINNLGLVLFETGRADEARGQFEKALALRPDYAEAYNNLGNTSREAGRLDEAMRHYRRAIELKPDFAQAYNNLGVLLQELDRTVEATAQYRKSLSLKPGYAEGHCNLAVMLHECGQREEAIEHYREALRLKPDYLKAKWGYCMAQIPLLYDTQDEIMPARQHYRQELETLAQTITTADAGEIATASRVVGTLQPYYLPYQGDNDRELQMLYGDLVCRIQAARYPEWAEKPPMPEIIGGEPLRIGVASRFFRYHSVWKMRIRGWIEQLDRDRFAMYGYCTGRNKDNQTDIARRSCHKFVEDIYSVEALCRVIRDDKLHVLIYPEIGMDPTALKLASLRLAPIQCSSWSHPETSGLSTIDYFLSNELMELPGADDHYSEKLVRLPNMGIYYLPPDIEPAAVDRSRFGLPPDAVVFLCAQFLPKYMPQHDDVFPRIAKEVGNCRFVFISFPKPGPLSDQFRRRLDGAFQRFGLESEKYVVLLPYLEPALYKALNGACDVYLDNIGWSGMNTTLEAMELGLPIVTLPGRFMRERHSYAALTMIGVTDTIVSSVDEYIALAVRLGRDETFRRYVAGRIKEDKHKAYRDITAIQALEKFLIDVVGRESE